MKVEIINLIIRNFKGVENLEINFGGVTNIDGFNGTGKTTIFDAFNWLLFGKDSHDAKDFNIKNTVNLSLNKLDHEVTGVLAIDGHHNTFKRVYKEKWVTKRGSSEKEMIGHETLFFYNDIPLSQAEYKTKVDSIINEGLAKLLTNPLYFNSLDWKRRREALTQIAGPVLDSDILAGIKNGDIILDILQSGKSLEEFKKEIAAKKKKAKDQLETIPTRIDEANRSKPAAVDYVAIEVEMDSKTKELANIDIQISDKVKASEAAFKVVQEKHNQINELQNQIRDIKNQDDNEKHKAIDEIDNLIRICTNGIEFAKQDIKTAQNEIDSNIKLIEKNDADATELRRQWQELNEKTLSVDPKDTCCPACEREFEADKVDEIKSKLSDNFNMDKVRRLNDMNDRGKEINSRSISLKNRNGELENKIKECNKNIETFSTDLEAHKQTKSETQNKSVVVPPAIEELNNKIKAINESITEDVTIDNSELLAQKTVLNKRLDELKLQLATKDQLTKINTRIAELEAEEKTLAQTIADYEQTEFVAVDFTRKKMDEIERRVNSKFSMVKFKMFETQINGGEAECCECLVNGVPYSDANTAGKINAGLDILNVLTKHYNISAPVWIDNRESIIELLPCVNDGQFQIINLRATPNKSLNIEAIETKQLETIDN